MYEEKHDRAIYEEAFAQAMAFASEGLRAERAMVTFSGNGRLHNLDAERIWSSEPISLSLLRALVEAGEPRLLVEMHERDQFNVTSVLISGIYCVLFVPIRGRTGEVCGFYYLDNRVRNGAFQVKDLKQVEAVVSGRLEPLLREASACRVMTWDVLMKTCWL